MLKIILKNKKYILLFKKMTTACLYFLIMVAIEIVPLTNKERKR
jgi:hypothetical protein